MAFPVGPLLGVAAVFAVLGAATLMLPDSPGPAFTAALPPEGPNLVGTVPYDGPADAPGILAACAGQEPIGCATGRLSELLLGKGALAAFDALDGLTRLDGTLNTQSHPIAHELGRYAYAAYGGIHTALSNCSYKVFSGCLHGALQAHFESLPDVGPAAVTQTCPAPRNDFEKYSCLHGLGHGLFLHTGSLNASLVLCDSLPDWFGQSSCHGGAFMENFVGWTDLQAGAGHGHAHGNEGQVVHEIDRARPSHPCDAVAERHQNTCWLLQTSVILWFNGGDFQAAARACDAAGGGKWTNDCYRSLGRDASSYSARDPAAAERRCSHASGAGLPFCIRGFVSEVVHNDADPARGLDACPRLREENRQPCYDEMAAAARSMLDAEGLAGLCSRVEAAHQQTCRKAAGLAG